MAQLQQPPSASDAAAAPPPAAGGESNGGPVPRLLGEGIRGGRKIGGLFLGFNNEEDVAYDHAVGKKDGTDEETGIGGDLKDLMAIRKRRSAEEAAEFHKNLKRQSRVYRNQINKRRRATLDPLRVRGACGSDIRVRAPTQPKPQRARHRCW